MKPPTNSLKAVLLTAILLFGHYPFSGQTVGAGSSKPGLDSDRLPERGLSDSELRPLDPSIEIERMIIDQMKALDIAEGFPTRIQKTKKATFADFALGIGINVDEIKGYAARADVKRLKQYLNFILAHEKAHQILSFRDPRSNSPRSPEEGRLYECQADILAAKYMIEAQGEPTAEDLESISDVLNVAFVIGTEGLSKAAHPTREQRRTAVRIGMAAGLLGFMSRQPPGPGLKEILVTLSDLINWIPGENVIQWSNRTARKVIHFGRSPSKDIVLLEDFDLDWDTNPKNPYVTYKYTYKNIGTRPVKLDMDFQCMWVPRDDPNDTFRWKKWSQKNYRLELSPGKTFTAEGRLTWGPLDENDPAGADLVKLMPRFIAPGANSFALATFDYADSGNAFIPGPLREGGATLSERLGQIDPNGAAAFILGLKNLVAAGRNGFKEDIMGPGAQFGDSISNQKF